MAGDAVCSNDALLLGLGQHVHDTAIACRPISFGDAVYEDNVDIVDPEFSPVTVKVGADTSGITSVGLGEDGHFIAGELLQGRSNVRMTAIGVCRIEETETIFVEAIEQQVG